MKKVFLVLIIVAASNVHASPTSYASSWNDLSLEQKYYMLVGVGHGLQAGLHFEYRYFFLQLYSFKDEKLKEFSKVVMPRNMALGIYYERLVSVYTAEDLLAYIDMEYAKIENENKKLMMIILEYLEYEFKLQQSPTQ